MHSEEAPGIYNMHSNPVLYSVGLFMSFIRTHRRQISHLPIEPPPPRLDRAPQWSSAGEPEGYGPDGVSVFHGTQWAAKTGGHVRTGTQPVLQKLQEAALVLSNKRLCAISFGCVFK